MSVRQSHIHKFNQKHNLDENAQFRQLIEEVGEFSEALNRDAPNEEIGEEIADIVFVARSIAEMRDINVTRLVNDTIEENLEKDSSTDGSKVTKDGLSSES